MKHKESSPISTLDRLVFQAGSEQVHRVCQLDSELQSQHVLKLHNLELKVEEHLPF